MKLPAILRRVFQRPATRQFDAAAPGRRWGSNPSFGNINAETLSAAWPVRRRSLYYSRNNPWLSNAVAALVSNIVGSGIRPSSQHPDPATRKALARLWGRWVAQADADGVLDFYGMQALAVRQMVEAGETFGVLSLAPVAHGVPLRLRLLDADMLDLAHTVELGGSARILGGIEFDSAGRRVAYHVQRRRPSDFGSFTGDTIRMPAADVCHLFNPLAPGQVRGIAWTAPILLRLHDLDMLEDGLLKRAEMAAMFGGFLTDPNGDPMRESFYESVSDGFDIKIQTGALEALPPGIDVKFATPGEASESVPFLKSQLRALAAGLGVPAHLLTGDLSEVNYSSIRASLVEFRRRLDALQYGVVIHQFCRPAWERFVTLAVLNGDLDAPDFEARMDDYLAVEFYPPAQEWVDPLKDGQAEAVAVAARFKSRRQVVAERGYDVEALDAEIAADLTREAALGIAPATTPVPQGAADAA